MSTLAIEPIDQSSYQAELREPQSDEVSSVALPVLNQEPQHNYKITDEQFERMAKEVHVSLSHKRLEEAAVTCGAIAIFLGALSFAFPILAPFALGFCILAAALEFVSFIKYDSNMEDLTSRIKDWQIKDSILSTENPLFPKMSRGKVETVFNSYPVVQETIRVPLAELVGETLLRGGFFYNYTAAARDFPYEVPGVPQLEQVEQDPKDPTIPVKYYQDEIINNYVEAVLELEGKLPLERLRECLLDKSKPIQQRKAIQLAAFFKLLGRSDRMIHGGAVHQQQGWDPTLRVDTVTRGQVRSNLRELIGQFPVMLTIVKERVPICFRVDEQHRPLAHYEMNRVFNIGMPNEAGNVICTMTRSMNVVLADDSHLE